ncbi:MAG: PPC domain-containing DNA-binding protein [Syntrophobacteraceae bacterium]
MARYQQVTGSKTWMGRLNHGADLLEELNTLCRREGARLGRIEALGAVQRACLGYYDQVQRVYQFITLDQHLEILNLTGNVSLKDGQPFVHAHVTLGDDEGSAFGGHLAPGTVIFACEFVLQVFDGPDLVREFDDETGLPLWQLPG